MVGRLIDAAEMRRGDGDWSAGLSVQTLACALSTRLPALCLPAAGADLAGTRGGIPGAWQLNVFGIEVRLDNRQICGQGLDTEKITRDAVREQEDYAFGWALYNGTGGSDMFVGGQGATTIASTKIADVIQAFYAKVVGVQPILHLGLQAAVDLAALFNGDGRLAFWPDMPIVVNAAYPVGAVFCTGPIELYAGTVQTIEANRYAHNTKTTEANELAAVSLDPCTVVIGGGVIPVQTYVAKTDTKVIQAYALNAPGSTTVNWGDGTANDTIAAGSSGPVTHTYTQSGQYTVTIGTSVYRVRIF